MRLKAAHIILAVLLCFAAGCAVQTAAPAATETQAPTPAPTEAPPPPTPSPTPKVGIEAVFGKPITIGIAGELPEDSLFLNGVRNEAKQLGVHLVKANAESLNAQVDALIAFRMDGADIDAAITNASNAGLPVCVFETGRTSVPDGASHIYYTPDGEAEMALEAALAYPPHDPPVRLILLFESRESAAYHEYEALYAQGKIFPKEVYIASESETDVQTWMTERLDDYVEGMLDGVFADSETLAGDAFDVLQPIGWHNTEVFCAGCDAGVKARMEAAPEVFAQAAGMDESLAGVLCVRACLLMLHSEAAVSLELTPRLIDAAQLQPDEELSAIYNADWMNTLRDYYAQ